MSFQNIYFKRATATSRACYVCSKPTATCLATTNAIDFIYTCDAHLSDPGFATEITTVGPNAAAAAAPKEAVSKEEIARVKAEWEAKEAAKKKKDNTAKAEGVGEKKKEKDGGDDEKKDSGGGDKSPSTPPVPGSLPSAPAGASSGATPTHKRYSLHRDFYAMRQAEHRRKRQSKQVHELAPRLPGAPRGLLPG